jgi:putative ABC transport system substrate-binding protein
MVGRRSFVAAVAAACTHPAQAQAPGRRYRIGYLGFTAVSTPLDERVWGGFVQRLRELGFDEGRNLVIEQRFAEGRMERYAEFAAEMVRSRADLVVVGSGTAARAVMAASSTMPIVTTGTPGDPVAAGLVASLARPGGQLTGMTTLSNDLGPKRIELLKEAVPSVRRLAFPVCSKCRSTSASGAAWSAVLRERYSFGPDSAAVLRRAADFVARILNGADPANLPMEQPTRFELVVDLKVARAIGVTIPQSVLLRADEVVQ